jgi:hypothetical protein
VSRAFEPPVGAGGGRSLRIPAVWSPERGHSRNAP